MLTVLLEVIHALFVFQHRQNLQGLPSHVVCIHQSQFHIFMPLQWYVEVKNL